MESQHQQPIIIRQSGGGGFFAKLGWLGFIVCAGLLFRFYVERDAYFSTTGGIQEKYHSGDKESSDNKVAIIEVSGIIASGEGAVKQQIERVREDDSVKAVVLRVDSPGGTVTGSDYIYHHLKKLKEERNIPIVVSMGSMAASGGYYISMAVGDEEDSIFAEPTTLTGSIGVIIPHYDVSGLMDKYDVKNDSIASHPRKQMLSMTRAMSEEHREIIQGQVNEMHARFVEIVQAGRPAFRSAGVTHEGVELATGETFTAPSAVKYGLVDKIGFIEDAIDRALEIAQLDKQTTRVIRYQSLGSLFDLPIVQSSAGGVSSELELLLEMSTPRAYYLTTTLPPFISNRRGN